MPGTLVNGTDIKELSYFYEIGVREKCLRHLRILHVSNSEESRHSSKRNTFEDDDSSVRLKTCLKLAGTDSGIRERIRIWGFQSRFHDLLRGCSHLPKALILSACVLSRLAQTTPTSSKRR